MKHKLARRYIDQNGNERLLVFHRDSPYGPQWLDEQGDVITIDTVKDVNGGLHNPWDFVTIIEEFYVTPEVSDE